MAQMLNFAFKGNIGFLLDKKSDKIINNIDSRLNELY